MRLCSRRVSTRRPYTASPSLPCGGSGRRWFQMFIDEPLGKKWWWIIIQSSSSTTISIFLAYYNALILLSFFWSSHSLLLLLPLVWETMMILKKSIDQTFVVNTLSLLDGGVFNSSHWVKEFLSSKSVWEKANLSPLLLHAKFCFL